MTIHSTDTIIDVRTAQEYHQGYLTDSINIPYTVIDQQIGDYVEDKNKKIIVYCRSGHRSGIAKNILERKGYTDVINAGSYQKLKNNPLQAVSS